MYIRGVPWKDAAYKQGVRPYRQAHLITDYQKVKNLCKPKEFVK